jgi:transketolase
MTTTHPHTSVTGFDDLGRLLTLMTGDEKHAPSALSTLDVIWVLYDRVLRVDPESARDPGRDRFLLSKGHGPMAYYAVLAAKGFVSEDDLRGFGRHESILGNHPDRTLIPGVEISSGSLGHGLPIAVGMALALGMHGNAPDSRIYCLIGDGELDEGSNAEAIALAARLGLAGLTVIVIDNGSSSHGWPGGIASRFEVEGWVTETIDGRDHDAIEAALAATHPSRPTVVVARVEQKS